MPLKVIHLFLAFFLTSFSLSALYYLGIATISDFPSWSVFFQSHKTLQDDWVEKKKGCFTFASKLMGNSTCSLRILLLSFATNIHILAWLPMLLWLFSYLLSCSHTFQFLCSYLNQWLPHSPLISIPVTLSVLTSSQRAKRVVSPLPGESIITPRIDTLTSYCLPRQVTE